jgi:hypothetical protein
VGEPSFQLKIAVSGHGYWQELVESIVWAHNKLKVASASLFNEVENMDDTMAMVEAEAKSQDSPERLRLDP